MTAPQNFLLRVNVTTDSAWKLTLTQRPASVDELKRIMQEKFKPKLDDVDFSLQYEDPDFNGLLTVLSNIEELPEKGMLKVVRTESDNSSLASSDTEIFPHVPLIARQKHWPSTFVVPAFSFEVEHVLEEGNEMYRESGRRLKLTRSQTHCILEKMAETMFSYKPYPNESQLAKAAEALVNAHPCLIEHGSHNPWYGWKVRLAHKMGNYRTIMAKSGCAEVAVNTGRRSRNNPDNAHPHSNIKKARRSEINFLPNFPKGENQMSLEQMRLQLIEEIEKTERDYLFIERCMQTTFALRRQEIVQGDLLVKDLLIRWPALQAESQVFAEFHRITNVNLRNTFYREFDRHTPTLFGLYRQKASRTGKIAEALQKILRAYDIQEEQDIHVRRILSLRALSIYLREDDSDLFRSCNQDGEPDVSECPLALISASEDIFTPGNISVVVEGNVIVSEIPKMLDAFLLLFDLIYVFNIEYPKKLANTFTFIQKVMVCLDDQTILKPCLLTLKNELFRE